MTVDVELLSCQELVELVTDYLEGALSPVDAARFEDHIGRCGACSIYVKQMRQTIEVLGHLPVDAVTPEAERDLLEAFRGWCAS
jgi:predicted anti-sigma-YlaC factor YlaD